MMIWCLVLVLAPTAALGQPLEPSSGAIEQALTRYRSEPSVDVVIHHALATSQTDPELARDLASHARLRGWVPTLRLGARRGLGRDLSTYESEDPRTTASTDDDLSLEASLTFDLPRLVFSHEEVALLREQRALMTARLELIRMIIHLYFERRRLMIERDLLGMRDVAHAIGIEEATALLNSFTGGAFGRMMPSTSP